jgi:hypothetical protein
VPFTLSHPAAALLLRRSGLPVAAVVAGTMAPDLPMFLPGRNGYGFTHSWTGTVTVDLVVALAGFAAWVLLLRDACVDLAPAAVRDRLPETSRLNARQWVLAPVGAVIGSWTHVVWDAWTHPGRWGVRQVTWLHTPHDGVLGAQWAQMVSTALGLLVVVAWVAVTLRRLPRRPRPPRVPVLAGAGAGWAVGSAAAVGGTAAVLRASHGLHALAFAGAVVGTVVLALAVVSLAGAWHLLRQVPSRPARSRPGPRP